MVDTSVITHHNEKIATLTGTGGLTPKFFELMIEHMQENMDTLQSRLDSVTTSLELLQPPVMPYEHRYLFTLIYNDNLDNQFDIFTIEEMTLYINYIKRIRGYKQTVHDKQRQIADLRLKLKRCRLDLDEYKDMLEIVSVVNEGQQ